MDTEILGSSFFIQNCHRIVIPVCFWMSRNFSFFWPPCSIHYISTEYPLYRLDLYSPLAVLEVHRHDNMTGKTTVPFSIHLCSQECIVQHVSLKNVAETCQLISPHTKCQKWNVSQGFGIGNSIIYIYIFFLLNACYSLSALMLKIPVGTNHYHVCYNVQPLPCLVLSGLHFACDSVQFLFCSS